MSVLIRIEPLSAKVIRNTLALAAENDGMHFAHALLAKVALGRLWLQWGYRKFGDYLRDELRMDGHTSAELCYWAITNGYEDKALYDVQ